MSRKRRVSQQCTVKIRDGSRCSRYCAPGEVVCALHQPNKPPQGVVAEQQTDDPLVVVQRLMKSRNEKTRLDAASLYVKLLEKQPRRRDDGDTPLDLWTEDELQELDLALQALAAVETRVRRRLYPHETRLTPGVNAILEESAAASIAAPHIEPDDPTDDGIDELPVDAPFEDGEIGQ